MSGRRSASRRGDNDELNPDRRNVAADIEVEASA
jgi:hypothetical protein